MKNYVFPIPRKHIEKIGNYIAGKGTKDFQQVIKHNRIKLSSNEAHWGASPSAINDLRRHASMMHVYPESNPVELCEAIAAFNGTSIKNIVLGNGSNEVIQFIIQTYVAPSENIIVPEITFSMYRIYAEIAGVKVRAAKNNYDYGINLDSIRKQITAKTKAIFITNPNNPTGLLINRMNLELFLMGIKKDIIVVIDEAYADFCDEELKPDLIEMINSGKYPNLVVLKTFSKAFGLAGLRLGYGIACEPLITNFKKVSQPFNVNSLAIIAALSSLKKLSHYHRIVNQTRVGKIYLEKKLLELEIPFLESHANFLMICVKNATKVANLMAAQGVIVRDLSSFGLPEYIRVTIADHDSNSKFITALNESYNKDHL